MENEKSSLSKLLKQEMANKPQGEYIPYYFQFLGYREHLTDSRIIARGAASRALFEKPDAFLYQNDLIAGSIRPLFGAKSPAEIESARKITQSFGERNFGQNFDHFAPNYEKFLRIGIPGVLSEIDESLSAPRSIEEKETLSAMKETMLGLQEKFKKYAAKARFLMGKEGYDSNRLSQIANACDGLVNHAPTSFKEALQLVWMTHICFVSEGRYAMALGRIDQYLYPYYEHDKKIGVLTLDEATELFENVFMKIYERRAYLGGDDVVNICIGGTSLDGTSDVNELSYAVLHAVKNVQIPGPNLSARISLDLPSDFLDECLQVIGTGLGYPALMNDTVNLKALSQFGYAKEDVYRYCMVGCIENFLPGRQAPWTDGRFDTPRFFEFLFHHGRGYFTPNVGLDTGEVSTIHSMEELLHRFEKQLDYGAKEYYALYRNENDRLNAKGYTSPFLSCFCDDCIARAKDVNMDGAHYPSVHGVCLMGIGTVCDSLSAIEKTVFVDHTATLEEIGKALEANFVGYEELHKLLLSAPKYGNNDPFVDKYAIWFVNYLSHEFSQFHTVDGGPFYVAMAANTNNIWAGKTIGATPDGRKAGQPLSDAASPTYGRDEKGATQTILSITKPDYTKVACGTVINQKFSPEMFQGEKRKKLLSLIRVYFEKGGQEMQINATSREVLKDAMKHPENYGNLVVRVSGFSAFYVTLGTDVQLDILNRTQQG